MILHIKQINKNNEQKSDIIVCDESKKVKEQTAIVGTSYKMKCTGQQEPTFTPSTSHATITIWSVNGSLPRGNRFNILTF